MEARPRRADRAIAARGALLVRAFFSVCLPGDRIERLAQADYEDELVRNDQLRDSPEARQRQAREETLDHVRARISRIRRDLGYSLLILVSAVLLALGLVHGLGAKPSAAASRLLGGASIFAFAWATLGRLGWAGKSWSGVTVIERLDEMIFRAPYWLGTLLGTISLL